MYGKQQWRGKEVEGRYADIMTFFVRELGNGIDVKSLSDYPHYYFTVEYMKESIKGLIKDNSPEIDAIRKILDTTNSVVTIEADIITFDHIPVDLFNRCHIIYRIQNKVVQNLKDTDTLSIDAGWYRVSQVTKCNMMHINPDNYKFDETV